MLFLNHKAMRVTGRRMKLPVRIILSMADKIGFDKGDFYHTTKLARDDRGFNCLIVRFGDKKPGWKRVVERYVDVSELLADGDNALAVGSGSYVRVYEASKEQQLFKSRENIVL
ncbi:hypothetical protein HY448_01510 [Candidatus Pacearchaeota archaeon]|nr:hypothetical protein [Candidatus Pacearchaeota archaeon]